MARPKKVTETPQGEQKAEFVTQEVFNNKFNSLESSISTLINLIQQPNAPQEATKMATEEKKVAEAGSDIAEVNPRYDAKAREILGDRVERTYVKYPKGGGTIFGIIIKKEFSNAPKDYMERMKEDCRSVNIEREEYRGEDGVAQWAKLVLQNLNRTLR